MQPTEGKAAFHVGAQAWASYNRSPLGRIRGAVTWHNLQPHLPAVIDGEPAPQVLDAGGGSGELAVQLVQRGYRVALVDYAPGMLGLANHVAEALAADLHAQLTTCLMSVEDAPGHFSPGSFDAVTCHTLIEYLRDPKGSLRGLAHLLCDEGLLSVSFVNRHAEVLRRAWLQADPAGALARLDHATFSAALFGLEGTAYTAEEVETWLAELGFTLIARCGVRIFADYLPRERLEEPAFFDAVLRLEKAAAEQSPYRSVARYGHLIARKQASGKAVAPPNLH